MDSAPADDLCVTGVSGFSLFPGRLEPAAFRYLNANAGSSTPNVMDPPRSALLGGSFGERGFYQECSASCPCVFEAPGKGGGVLE